jgi:hypothetical protein
VSRIWITAQPSASEIVLHMNRRRLRRAYRLLRKSMPAYQARWVIRDLLHAAQTEFKP